MGWIFVSQTFCSVLFDFYFQVNHDDAGARGNEVVVIVFIVNAVTYVWLTNTFWACQGHESVRLGYRDGATMQGGNEACVHLRRMKGW